MAIEGELNVRLAWDGRNVHGVSIVSTRPFAAARVLAGMAPAEATATVARLFGICGIAQETASAGALDAASGADPAAAAHADAVPVELEAIQEYLWRLLIDWPQAMGREMNVAPVADVRRRIADAQIGSAARRRSRQGEGVAELAPALGAIAAAHVYGTTPDAFLALADIAALDGWIARADTLPAALLGMLLAIAASARQQRRGADAALRRRGLIAHCCRSSTAPNSRARRNGKARPPKRARWRGCRRIRSSPRCARGKATRSRCG